jgi:transposase InsO family protein
MAVRIGITGTSRSTGISRFTLYDWRRRVKLAASWKASESPVSGPDEDLRRIREQRILSEWKKHPGLGPSQIRNQLRRQTVKVSVHTVRRVMEENGYVLPKVRRDSTHNTRYEAIRPNHLWHLDFFHRYVHKQQVFVLLIIDDYSRFIVGWAIWDAERGEAVLRAFESAVNRYGRPETVMSDGGSAFHAWRGVGQFTRYLEELGVDQLIAETPEENGKVEVLNANVQKELFNQEMFFDLAQTLRRLDSWISFYNLRRTHHALGGLLVPADRYFGRVDEVLAQIEAGRPAEAVGEPLPVGERQLDILKVTTQKGFVSVTLMGQQIWPAS